MQGDQQDIVFVEAYWTNIIDLDQAAGLATVINYPLPALVYHTFKRSWAWNE